MYPSLLSERPGDSFLEGCEEFSDMETLYVMKRHIGDGRQSRIVTRNWWRNILAEKIWWISVLVKRKWWNVKLMNFDW